MLPPGGEGEPEHICLPKLPCDYLKGIWQSLLSQLFLLLKIIIIIKNLKQRGTHTKYCRIPDISTPGCVDLAHGS